MNYSYLNHDQLVSLIKSRAQHGKDYQVVDVRDEDFRGGNIPGAIRAPSEARTDETVRALVERLEAVPVVIFHCSLSQVRGPKNARIYADAVAARRQAPSSSSQIPDAGQSTTVAGSEDHNFSPNPFPTTHTTKLEGARHGAEEDEARVGQKVYVLRDGFANWQGLYRKDPELVENFDPTIWSDYAS
ncbi:hypothetical protein JCM10212_003718 [Sporobolomyces blumeae]